MKLKIVNKKRFIISITALCFLLLSCTCAAISNKTSKNISYNKRYVYNGDTLWSIAEEEKETNSYYKDKDIRDIIYDLKKINNMENSSLFEGQELYIPYLSNFDKS